MFVCSNSLPLLLSDVPLQAFCLRSDNHLFSNYKLQISRVINWKNCCFDSSKMSGVLRTIRPFLRCVSGQTRSYADASAISNEMKFTFAGANQVFYDQVAIKQVDVPSFSGSFGILPKHVPTLAVLKPGVVTVYEQDGNTKKVFVSSGTVTINEDNSVQILAEEAHPVENLDNSAARDILNKAQQELSAASSDKGKAEAAIAIEVAEALVQASQ